MLSLFQVRTLQYSALHSDDDSASAQRTDDSVERVPWDTLVSLSDRLPTSEQESPSGEFACVILRVKELYEAARDWQEQISSFTKLSLRGVKRRNPLSPSATKSPDDDSKEQPPIIGVGKLAELCQHPILEKVRLLFASGVLFYRVTLTPTTFPGCNAEGKGDAKYAAKLEKV